VAFDEGEEFADEEILVAHFAVARVDVEAAVGAGRDDQEFADLLLLPHVFDEVPAALGEQGLRVFSEAVEEIENGKFARVTGFVAGRQEDAVGDGVLEDCAGR